VTDAFPANRLVDRLLAAGFDFFTGVPCSLVRTLIAELERRGLYRSATREDLALGAAAGAYLGGKLPVVVMQNSGLGVSVNALASLHLLYDIPCLLVVTWRGYEGKDAPEHIVMGRIMPGLLDLLGVPHRAPLAEELERELAWASAELARTHKPVALVIRPGLLE
jgi:sulfopyruvate decarboxylase subunit alpha